MEAQLVARFIQVFSEQNPQAFLWQGPLPCVTYFLDTYNKSSLETYFMKVRHLRICFIGMQRSI